MAAFAIWGEVQTPVGSLKLSVVAIFVSAKEKAHDKDINVLLNIGEGFIASGSDDYKIKIW